MKKKNLVAIKNSRFSVVQSTLWFVYVVLWKQERERETESTILCNKPRHKPPYASAVSTIAIYVFFPWVDESVAQSCSAWEILLHLVPIPSTLNAASETTAEIIKNSTACNDDSNDHIEMQLISLVLNNANCRSSFSPPPTFTFAERTAKQITQHAASAIAF